jgi:hypothetical protein
LNGRASYRAAGRSVVMSRARVKKLFPIALSINAAADALMCRPDEVRELIAVSGIPVFQQKMRRRVLVQDLVAAIRTHWPKVETKKRASP